MKSLEVSMKSDQNVSAQEAGAFSKGSELRGSTVFCGILALIGVIVVAATMKSGEISNSEIFRRSARVYQLRNEIIREERDRLEEWKKLNHAVESDERFNAAMSADGLHLASRGTLKSCGSIGVGTDAAFSFENGALQYRVENVSSQKTVLVHTYDKDGIFIETVAFDVDGEYVWETRELTESERSWNRARAASKYQVAIYNALNSKADPLSLEGLGNTASVAWSSAKMADAEKQTHTSEKRWRPATCTGRVMFLDKAKIPVWYSVRVCDPGVLKKTGKFIRELF